MKAAGSIPEPAVAPLRPRHIGRRQTIRIPKPDANWLLTGRARLRVYIAQLPRPRGQASLPSVLELLRPRHYPAPVVLLFSERLPPLPNPRCGQSGSIPLPDN